MEWYKADGYFYKTFFEKVAFDNPKYNLQISRSSDFTLSLMILVLILIYSIVIYFADHLVESNRGHIHNPIKKLFSKCYKKKSHQEGSTSKIELKKNGNIV